MPASTALGFPYPVPGDQPDGPAAVQPLAAALDAFLTPVYSYATCITAQAFASSGAGIVNTWTFGAGATRNISYSGGTWTVTVAGFYLISAELAFAPAGSPAGIRQIDILINGSQVAEFVTRGDSGFALPMPVRWGQPLAVGDTIQIQGFQSQGSGLALSASAKQNNVSIMRASA
jgi:hypothetical protein